MVKLRPYRVMVELPGPRARCLRFRHDVRRLWLRISGRGFSTMIMAACLPTSLHAQSSKAHVVIAASSQLVDRGLAMTPPTPILQGAVSWRSPAGWSLGVSGSTEMRAPHGLTESLVQVSRSWLLSDNWQMRAGVLYYHYSGVFHARAYDRVETDVDWSYRDVLTIGISTARAIDAPEHRPIAAVDLNIHWPVTETLFVTAGAGVAQPPPLPSGYHRGMESGLRHHTDPHPYDHSTRAPYRYGQVGLMWRKGPWRIELDRIASDLKTRRGVDLNPAPWIATISRSF